MSFFPYIKCILCLVLLESHASDRLASYCCYRQRRRCRCHCYYYWCKYFEHCTIPCMIENNWRPNYIIARNAYAYAYAYAYQNSEGKIKFRIVSLVFFLFPSEWFNRPNGLADRPAGWLLEMRTMYDVVVYFDFLYSYHIFLSLLADRCCYLSDTP